jgi:hypothetical protein
MKAIQFLLVKIPQQCITKRKPYFTGDKIKILKPKDKRFNKNNAQFFISTMMKAFSSFSWGSSSFNVNIIKNQKVSLPVKKGQ